MSIRSRPQDEGPIDLCLCPCTIDVDMMDGLPHRHEPFKFVVKGVVKSQWI